MSNKDYKGLATSALDAMSKEQDFRNKEKISAFEEKGWSADEAAMIVHLQGEWRRSAQNYELPPDDDTAWHFEVIGSEVVENTESTVAIAFALAGLNPRNPSHWYDLLSAFTDLHLKRKPKKKKRTKPFLDELKDDAERIAAESPEKTRSDVIDELREKHPMIAASTLGGLLSKVKASGFAKSYRRRDP